MQLYYFLSFLLQSNKTFLFKFPFKLFHTFSNFFQASFISSFRISTNIELFSCSLFINNNSIYGDIIINNSIIISTYTTIGIYIDI